MIAPAEALKELREGNRRFVSGEADAESLARRSHRPDLAAGQDPIAIILACSDSRVPVEMVFDRGFGDLFVVRVAGNVSGPTPIGSIEYAVEQFGTPLVVVLGHSRCGAVMTTLAELAGELALRSPGLRAIVDRVRPAVEPILVANGNPHDPGVIEQSVRANIRASVRRLSNSSGLLERRIDAGQLIVVGAEYSIETGVVEFLDGGPE